jgi:hypothetical protein
MILAENSFFSAPGANSLIIAEDDEDQQQLEMGHLSVIFERFDLNSQNHTSKLSFAFSDTQSQLQSINDSYLIESDQEKDDDLIAAEKSELLFSPTRDIRDISWTTAEESGDASPMNCLPTPLASKETDVDLLNAGVDDLNLDSLIDHGSQQQDKIFESIPVVYESSVVSDIDLRVDKIDGSLNSIISPQKSASVSAESVSECDTKVKDSESDYKEEIIESIPVVDTEIDESSLLSNIELCVDEIDAGVDDIDAVLSNGSEPECYPGIKDSESDYKEEIIQSIPVVDAEIDQSSLLSNIESCVDKIDDGVDDIDAVLSNGLELECDPDIKDSESDYEKEFIESIPVVDDSPVYEIDAGVNTLNLDSSINDGSPQKIALLSTESYLAREYEKSGSESIHKEELIESTPLVDENDVLPLAVIESSPVDSLSTLLNLSTSPVIQTFSSLESLLKKDSRAMQVVKLGEATFAEVFRVTTRSGECALKLVPFDGTSLVNGEVQQTAANLVLEAEITVALDGLVQRHDGLGFIRLNGLHIVQGSYPDYLLNVCRLIDYRRGINGVQRV